MIFTDRSIRYIKSLTYTGVQLLNRSTQGGFVENVTSENASENAEYHFSQTNGNPSKVHLNQNFHK